MTVCVILVLCRVWPLDMWYNYDVWPLEMWYNYDLWPLDMLFNYD